MPALRGFAEDLACARERRPPRQNPRGGTLPGYSAVACPNVPDPQRQRRDRLLAMLRGAHAGQTATELRATMAAEGERDYTYDLCTGDLRQLERYGLARSVGHPKRWTSRP